ncbi:MAG: kelch repeat-containing protein [Tepidisphaeraceae bacterium]
MIRIYTAVLLLLAAAHHASAHFVFVVPDPNGSTAKVYFSEDLKPDEDVDVELLRNAKLTLSGAGRHGAPLELTKSGSAFVTPLPGSGLRVVTGVLDLGVMQRGKSKPHVLIYHPRTVIGDPFNAHAAPHGDAIVEIAPQRDGEQLRFQVLVDGKPKPDAEVTVIHPGGTEQVTKTDAAGVTPAFAKPGRYGAWARHWIPEPGERDGKKYDEIRHYATLVIDFAASYASATPTTAPSTAPSAARFIDLPEATSSFGAASSDGWLYVYGGHIAPTHNYSITAVSGRFHRVNLTDGKTWEELPSGPAMQGMNLVAHGGFIYRIGGMSPRNQPGEKADNHSVAECARFDPKTMTWQPLPPLPQPRSSHDVVVVNDQLFVLGGWTLAGRGKTNWPETALSLNLRAPDALWKPVPQPFARRAVIATVHDDKIVVIGGFDENSDPSLETIVYDPKSDKWTPGPSLPGEDQNGFAPAACTHDGIVYASVADGSFLRLAGGKRWEKLATTTPRIVHRLIPRGNEILVLGGADGGRNFNLIERVPVKP